VHIASSKSACGTSAARLSAGVISLAWSVFLAAALAGCGNRVDTEPLAPTSILITTPSGTTSVTGTIQFSATVMDADGHTIQVTPAWSVVNGGGAITSDGLFTAGDSVGTFENTVVATTGTVTSSSTVIVTAGGLASITVTPDTVRLAIGSTQQFLAVGKDAHGNVVDIPNRVWSVASGGGTIDTAGLFTAGTTAGAFAHSVTATSGSISGTASVTVLPGLLASITVSPPSSSLAIGAQQTFTAVGYDDYDNIVPITPTWLVVSGGGTIDASGVFTAGTVAGTFTNTVVARVGSGCGGINGRATVIVAPGALTTVTVSPSNPSLFGPQSKQFTATGYDASNNVVAIPGTLVWSVTPSTIHARLRLLMSAGVTARPFLRS
jgi:hypothetical protein